MQSLRCVVPTIRKIIANQILKHKTLGNRTIMTTNKLLNDAVEDLKKNPYFDKYANKIAALQQSSPEQFLSRIAEHVESKKRSKGTSSERPVSVAASSGKHDKFGKGASTIVKPKQLSDVMKLDLVTNKSAEEIGQIWHTFYKDKDAIAAVIPVETYEIIQSRAAEFSTFIFPLPRSSGYEFVVCQFSGNDAHFTTLINFQAYKENAPECLTITHYSDLATEKGIVLMQGEFDKDVINVQEAQCLANQLQLYYGCPDEKKERLLKRFTYTPVEFNHMDLVAELELITLSNV